MYSARPPHSSGLRSPSFAGRAVCPRRPSMHGPGRLQRDARAREMHGPEKCTGPRGCREMHGPEKCTGPRSCKGARAREATERCTGPRSCRGAWLSLSSSLSQSFAGHGPDLRADGSCSAAARPAGSQGPWALGTRRSQRLDSVGLAAL